MNGSYNMQSQLSFNQRKRKIGCRRENQGPDGVVRVYELKIAYQIMNNDNFFFVVRRVRPPELFCPQSLLGETSPVKEWQTEAI